ncbi:hypothetical protein FZEAL_5141 [Fusarium zealandicum]|uniref:RRM domain-containing protein n=1 Tax=Fusarium zealandicum TaxID=1053134 RepID=A0A8H4XK53_9HYPO|nr:hypothetical protein FZEAL_5141 [Fusarium zealandicum]
MAQPHLPSMGESPSWGPPPPFLPAADCSRVYAKDQPPNLQAAFTECYPNGLPDLYKMLQTPGVEGVAQTYVEEYLPIGFFTNPRTNARAIFSTLNGQRQFRRLDHLLPRRRIHLWTADEIQSVCNSLRKVFWDHMKTMQQPYSWDSLWTYFDAFDLYHYGAMNLWNVVKTLCDENAIIYTDLTKELAIHIGHWADGWLASEANQKKLLKWDGTHGPLLPLLSKADWKEIGNVQDDTIPMISSALKHRRSLILESGSSTQHAKANDLVSSCLNHNLENWLAGQKVFSPTGLPSPPEARSHRCSPVSMNAPAPVHVHNGNHYYLPPSHKPSAAEILQQSVEAAGGHEKQQESGPIVAHGSSKTNVMRPSMVQRNRVELQIIQEPQELRSKSTEPTTHFTLPLDAKLARKPNAIGASSSVAPHDGTDLGDDDDDEFERLNSLTPTKVRRRGRDNPRSARGAPKATVTASLPASAVMGFSELASSSEPTVKSYCPTDQATSESLKPNQLNGPNEVKHSKPFANNNNQQSKGQTSYRPGALPVFSDSTNTQYPVDGHSLTHSQRVNPGPRAVAAPNGIPEQRMFSQAAHPQTALGFTFHPAGAFAHGPSGGYTALQPNLIVPTGIDHRQQLEQQQSAVSQRGFMSQRGRNSSISSRLERFSNDGQWSHQHRTESFNALDPLQSTPNRGGYQRGGPRRGGNRRGSINQRNATAPVAHGGDLGPTNKKREFSSWNNPTWRRSGSNSTPLQVVCQNTQGAQGTNDYVPCSCEMCNTRNRSIHVRVEGHHQHPTKDLQTRIKGGLSDSYGFVEEVYPVSSQAPGKFMVRFRNETSVADALAVGGGILSGRGIAISITPALRSKWMTLPVSVHHNRGTHNHPLPTQPAAQLSSVPPLPHPTNVSMAVASPGILGAPVLLPGMIHPVATKMQMVPGEFGLPAYYQPESQTSPSGFVRSFSGQLPAATQPAVDPHHYLHQEHRMISTPLAGSFPPCSPVFDPQTALGENLQSKPPAEEALDEIHDGVQDGMASPRSDGSKASGIRARVSLPNTPPKASQAPQTSPDAQPSPKPATIEIVSDEETPVDATAESQSPDAKIVSAATPVAEAEPPKYQNGHARVPSIFTENEIKERRQAWAKISMPLNPRRPKLSSPNKAGSADIKNASLQIPKADGLEAGTNRSEMSSPTQVTTFTPETGSVYDPSPSKLSDRSTPQHEQRGQSPTHLDQEKGEDEVIAAIACGPNVKPSQTNAAEPTATEEAVSQCPKISHIDAARQSCQDDGPPRDSLLSTPTKVNGVKTVHKAGETSAETSHLANECETPPDAQHKGRTKKGKGKKKNSKKTKQPRDAQENVSNAHAVSQPRILEGSQKPLASEHSSSQPAQATNEQLHSALQSDYNAAQRPEGQEYGTPSPPKRHHEDVDQPLNSDSMKRSKTHSTDQDHSRVNQIPTQQTFDESDSPDEDARGRKGFRMGRGGSLRIGKQRRPRPLMTGPTLVEQHVENQVSPPSSEFAFECLRDSGSNGSSGLNGAKSGAKSRLNPKAQEFVSPSRPANTDNSASDKSICTKSSKGETCVDSFEPQHGTEATGSKSLRTGAHSRGASLREYKSAQTENGAPQSQQQATLDEIKRRTHNNETSSKGEGRKASTKGNKRGKGKERAVATSEKIEENPVHKEEKPQGAPHTPEQKVTREKQPGLVADDWPSLPGPRERAASKPQTPSVWSAKKKAAGQDSPLNKE